MKNAVYRVIIALGACLFASASFAAPASDPAFDAELLSLQQAWAHANYEIPAGDARLQAFDALEKRAGKFTRAHPERAEARIWEGIIESSYAGAKGGLGALSLCRKAKGNLEAALELDPRALDGSAYTSLGTLYFKVPGFPLGFGDDTKAGQLLRQALELNPDGIDPNYFYAEYLFEQERFQEALQYLDKAGKARPRPGRESADAGRRAEIATLRQRVRTELG
jgi:tetratricopeptide (TPR) repeat protein